MNDLNSVLIEGKVVGIKELSPEKIRFTISSQRFHKEPGDSEIKKEVHFFDIAGKGRLALFCENLKPDTRVRIVGRMIQKDNMVLILAEHIEIKKQQ